jgi:hypothetical protein
MHVNGHLPLRWRSLSPTDAEAVRSAIMDKAVARSWKIRPEGHVSVTEELAPLIRRLNELDEKLDRVLKRLDHTETPKWPMHPLTLNTEDIRLAPLEGEVFPPAESWVEVSFQLPPEDDDALLVLCQSKGDGWFSFVTMAQDQMDHLVRYLLNRQRLAQTDPNR